MRHFGSLLITAVFAPSIFLLTGTGLSAFNSALDDNKVYDPLGSLAALGALLLAGVLYGILVMARLSPLGPGLAGLASMGISGWALLDLQAYQEFFSQLDVHMGGAVGETGLGIMLGIPLLATVFSGRRWRGSELYAPQAMPVRSQADPMWVLPASSVDQSPPMPEMPLPDVPAPSPRYPVSAAFQARPISAPPSSAPPSSASPTSAPHSSASPISAPPASEPSAPEPSAPEPSAPEPTASPPPAPEPTASEPSASGPTAATSLSSWRTPYIPPLPGSGPATPASTPSGAPPDPAQPSSAPPVPASPVSAPPAAMATSAVPLSGLPMESVAEKLMSWSSSSASDSEPPAPIVLASPDEAPPLPRRVPSPPPGSQKVTAPIVSPPPAPDNEVTQRLGTPGSIVPQATSTKASDEGGTVHLRQES